MLEFFRYYQRYFFLIIAVVVIASFTFFGTYNTFAGTEERIDQIIGQKMDGSDMRLSEVQKLARFIATDREDPIQGRGSSPNFCNDGVIRNDFIKCRLAHLLAAEYFDLLKTDFIARLDKAKRFRSYAHPEAPFLSAKTVWQHFLPGLNEEVATLTAETEVTPAIFSKFAKLYEFQSQLQPETLRRILMYQHKQYSWLHVDQRLAQDDLALFGFHSTVDWFGHNFVDLTAEFILNAAVVAEKKGYRVSLEEAKGDLIHNFQESATRLQKAGIPLELSFNQHLQKLGFDEHSAVVAWQKVLLFRRYLHDVGEAAFVDKLPYKEFSEFAHESALVQKYQWPLKLATAKDLAELQFYIKAVAPNTKGKLPHSFLSVAEVAQKHPTLVESKYKANIREVPKKQIALKAKVKQVWDWQLDDKNWVALRKQFSLGDASTREGRFELIEKLDLKLRAQVDEFVRMAILAENPSWVEEALAAAPVVEKTWSVAANQDSAYRAEEMVFVVENLEKIEDAHILTFAQARNALSALVASVEGECPKEKNLFASVSKEALSALEKNPMDPNWVQSGNDPLIDQFKLERKEQKISRTAQENWMKEQAFLMIPGVWSLIQVADDGQVVFFYLQERKAEPAPILDQISFGKETLSADAKIYVAERLLKNIKMKNAIVIPVQKEDE